MNNYLIESTDSLSLENEASKLIKDNKFTKASVYKYDLEETELENALEDLDTYGLFTQEKVIILKNIESLKYDDYKSEFEHLFRYLDNPNPDNLLFIWSLKFNNTLKITKELKKRMDFIEVKLDPIKYTKEKFKGYKINNNLIEYLVDKCLNDISKIDNEVEKLKTYKLDEKEILKEDIDELVMDKLGDATDLTFQFSRSLAEKDKKEELNKYFELLNYNI